MIAELKNPRRELTSNSADLRSVMNGATVFIVDGDAAARREIRTLSESAGMKVETFESAEDFLAQFDRGQLGCLVLDFCLPGLTGLQLLERLNSEGVMIPSIVISSHADVSAAVKAIKRGAVDVFQRPFSEIQMLEAIRSTIASHRRKQQLQQQTLEFERMLEMLNDRERQIVDRVIEGHATKKIALEMQVSIKTIEACRTHIMNVLRVSNAAELAAKVARVKFRREWGLAG